MKKVGYLLVLSFLLTPLGSCTWDSKETVKGNGELSTETRSPDNFRSVTVEGPYEIEVIAGDQPRVVIEAESNLMEYIITEVEDGKLTIKNKKDTRLRPDKDLVITVFTDELEDLRVLGSGSINTGLITGEKVRLSVIGPGSITTSAQTTELRAIVNGSGKIDIAGRGDKAHYSITGSGKIQAAEFETESARANITGSGAVHCRVNEELESSITGSGKVIYSGQPELSSKVTGSGSVRAE